MPLIDMKVGVGFQKARWPITKHSLPQMHVYSVKEDPQILTTEVSLWIRSPGRSTHGHTVAILDEVTAAQASSAGAHVKATTTRGITSCNNQYIALLLFLTLYLPHFKMNFPLNIIILGLLE